MSLHKSSIIEKAQKLSAKGQYAQAIKEWEKLIATFPDDGNTYNSIGDLHLKEGKKKQATDLFIKAAETFQLAGFEQKSIAVFKKVLKLVPSRIEIREKLADVYASRGLVGNAMSDYRQAAEAYLSQKNFESSLSVYRKISDLAPENVDILLTIAEMCQEKALNDKAIETYQKLVTLFENKDQPSESEKMIQKILALDPSYPVGNGGSSSKEAESAPTAELKAGVDNDEDQKNISGLETLDKASPEPLEFFEPEPELMTDEQTIYASEDTFQIGVSQEEHNFNKSLEGPLPEAEAEREIQMAPDKFQAIQSSDESLIQPKTVDEEKVVHTDTAQFELDGPVSEFGGDAFPEEALFQEISPEAAAEVEVEVEVEEEEEEISLFETEAIPDLASGDLALESLDDELAVLEQDPQGSTADTTEDGVASVDDLFIDSDPFRSGISEESAIPDDACDIDFDEISPGLSALDNIEVDAMGMETGKTPVEEPKQFSIVNNAAANEESHAKTQEDYISLQSYFSDELEGEDKANPDRTIRTVQDKNPEEIESEYDLGIAYREMGMLSKAVKAFETASRGKSRFKDATTMLATCHRELGAVQDAFASLEEGLSRSHSDQSATITFQYELALLHEAEKNLEKASRLYDAVFAIDPNYREVTKKRAQVHRQISASSSSEPTESFRVIKQKSDKKKDRVSYL